MKVSPARAAAFDILFRIETENAFSSTLLPIYQQNLSDADRGLCHEIVLGTLRRLIYFDRHIDYVSGGKKIDVEVRIALRIGLYQIYFLDRVPDHSAINESVELVQRAKKTSAKGFANAVLRRATREKVDLQFADEIEHVSVMTSHPRWLIERWSNSLGLERASAIAEANNEVPHSAFRFLGDKPEKPEWAESRNVDGAFVANGIDRTLREMHERNEIYFQDEASQMVAAAVRIPANGSFFDICAAPGGKTGMIALAGRDAKLVIAGDLYTPRVEFLKANCLAQRATNVNVVQYDATMPLPFAEESFDSILLDAPCSGTGTIRHNPEIRYFLQPEDFPELSRKQQSILQNASKLLKKGGSLVYSTCSMEREENEDVIAGFLTAGNDFETVEPNVPDRFLTDRNFARTWPDRDSLDGFFIAELRRR